MSKFVWLILILNLSWLAINIVWWFLGDIHAGTLLAVLLLNGGLAWVIISRESKSSKNY